MGCFGSKEKLSKEDLEFLKQHTRYDEQMIKEWYKGFRVSTFSFLSLTEVPYLPPHELLPPPLHEEHLSVQVNIRNVIYERPLRPHTKTFTS